MVFFKIRYQEHGIHIKCDLFASSSLKGGGYQLLGSFTCNQEEFIHLKGEMRNTPFESRELENT